MVGEVLRRYFPGMPYYERFVALQPSVLIPLLGFLLSRRGHRTGIYYIDSTALAVCHNRRIGRHKTFAGLAARGKTSLGWFFGFKLHLVFNHLHEIVALKLTPGNVPMVRPSSNSRKISPASSSATRAILANSARRPYSNGDWCC
ncbi:MAG: transposase [Deltaproteobacteria bacterium]|nr:transposase [Deltaproteobacteria bacterium]